MQCNRKFVKMECGSDINDNYSYEPEEEDQETSDMDSLDIANDEIEAKYVNVYA